MTGALTSFFFWCHDDTHILWEVARAECSQIQMEGGMMIPVTEAERRESFFLKAIGDDHPLTKAIISCIHNDPNERMHVNEIVEYMSEMVSQFPI